jgi:hypothetical protein
VFEVQGRDLQLWPPHPYRNVEWGPAHRVSIAFFGWLLILFYLECVAGGSLRAV